MISLIKTYGSSIKKFLLFIELVLYFLVLWSVKGNHFINVL